MKIEIHNFAWHRSLGLLIEQLGSPEFWSSLVRLLNEYVTIDNWVALIFANQHVEVVSFVEWADESERDGFHKEYVNGLYLLDPFYIANRENPVSGLFHLLDIAPTHFSKTEYYNEYFKKYIVADEVSYNVKLDSERTLCLSLGSQSRFTQEQIAMLELVRPWVVALMRQRMNFELEKITTQQKPSKWQDTMAQLSEILTMRELEIVKLLFSGFSNVQIAGKLSISLQTVKAHRRNFYAKLNVKSQTELFALFFNE